MQRGLPSAQFRLRKGHLFYLLDLAIAAILFMITGNLYMDARGNPKIAEKQQELQQARQSFVRKIAEADSVMAYKRGELEEMRADSLNWYRDYALKIQVAQQGFAERQTIADRVVLLSGQVQNLMAQAQQAVVDADSYEGDVQDKESTIGSLASDSEEHARKLEETRQARLTAAERLRDAYAARTHEPAGYFPDKSGVAVKSEVADTDRLTMVELQRVLTSNRNLDVGVALGVGIGSGDRSSSKQLGVLLSRPLVHRRLGLDVSAGYEHLTDDAGADQGGAYAAAGLRVSPLYKERLHFGLGTRVSDGEVLPYVSVAIGRR